MKTKLPKNVIRMTKFSIYAIILCQSIVMVMASNTEAQRKYLKEIFLEISSSPESRSLLALIHEIESKGDFVFAYSKRDLKSKSIALAGGRWDMDNLLREISIQSKLSIKRVNEVIALLPIDREVSLPHLSEKVSIQWTISGKITDENGGALPGATVLEKGTSNGVITDIDGRFKIEVSENAILTISFVGFKTIEAPVNGQTMLEISMTPDFADLEEVVVIGYGTSTKRELTGSVASISPKEFNPGPVTDAMQLIQGKVAGLSVTRTNGGDPTAGFEVRLRGASSVSADQAPLVVIDGIPGGNLANIPPENIASIDILKDGSAAAIYGTRGTNGVIMITTKKGKKGQTKIEYSARFFTESPLRKIDVLSADQYRQMKEDIAVRDPELANSMIDYGHDTDWYDEITRTPMSHIQNLSLSGGSENSTYRLSVFYVNQEGILLESKNKEFRVNLNLNQSAFNNRLRINTQLGIVNYLRNPVDYNAIRQVIQRNPTEPVYNEDGSLTEYIGAWQYDNPVGLLTERVRDDGGSRMFGNLGFDLDLTNELTLGVLGGLQVNRSLNGYYQPSYSLPQETAGSTGSATRKSSLNSVNTFESVLKYAKQINKHQLNLLGGYSFQEFTNEGFEANNRNFLTDDLTYNNLGSGTWLQDGRASMSSYKDESRLIGLFARMAYNYNGKYFLSASVRREGSSKFGTNNKWGTFPAISAAWDLSREGFFRQVSALDYLKLRVGYGVTGNQGIPPYLSLTQLGQGSFYYYQGRWVPSVQPISNPNPNLKWETKHEVNIGLDWGLTSGRVSGTIDGYIRDTKDLLHRYNVPVPPNIFPTTWANVGSLRNSGIELTINAVPVISGDFRWNIAFNTDFRSNKLLSLSNDFYSIEYRNVGEIGSPGISAWTHQYREGAPLGIIHGFVYEGIDEEGKWIFKDFNPITGESDGVVDIDDRDDIGNGIPDFYAGLTNTFQYKKFDLSIMMRGMFGHQIINAKRIWHENPKFLPRNVMVSTIGTQLWDDPQFSSYYVENGDFVKIDNVTIGYTLPFENIPWLQSGRIYTTVTNAFLLTNYSGVDPELGIGGLEPGHDNRFDYPSTRTYTLGFNLTF